MLRGIVRANRHLAAAVERRLPLRRLDISLFYERRVGEAMRNLPGGATVVDAGAGDRCSFYEYRPSGVNVIGVDASEQALRANRELDDWRVADITRRLPFADGTIDIVASKHVLEHLPDITAFLAEVWRVLKPGGATIHLLPSRYSLAALLSRLLPDDLRQRVVNRLHPETTGTTRFHTYYHRCSPAALEASLRQAGFSVEQTVVSYYGAHYFGFFLPLYLLAATWESLCQLLGARCLAATFLVVARKPDRPA